MDEFEITNERASEQESGPEILVSRAASAPSEPRALSAEPSVSAAKPTAAPRPVRKAVRAVKSPAAPAAKTVSSVPKPSRTVKAQPPISKTPIDPLPKVTEPVPEAQTLFIQNLFAPKEEAEKKEKKKPLLPSEKKPVGEDAPSEQETEQKPTVDGGGIVVSVLKAVIYIAFVLVVSGFLAIYGIRIANDIFAFVKDEMTVEVTVTEGMTLEDVSEILYEKGLIENADWFRIYTEFKNKDKMPEFVAGTYTLNSTMNYNTLFSSLTPRAGRAVVSVTIPEGYTVDQIIDLLVSEGIGTREGYVDAVQNYDYNYEFMDVLESIELSEARKYRLEGYLYPDTYEFYRDASEVAVLDKMLTAFQEKFLDAYSDRMIELDMNMDEVIILASMIEREALKPTDMYYISAVFHNRLNNSASFPYLGSDATVQYVLPEHKAELTKADLEIDSPYNTHKYKGLPPGAICNPSFEAIEAALYPDDYLMQTRGVKSYYFVAGVDGYSLFGADQNEHQRNINKVRSDREAALAAQG